MSDPYPEELPIEIDRDGLRRYLRLKWGTAWVTPLAFFGIILGPPGSEHFAKGTDSPLVALLAVLLGGAAGLAAGVLIALMCYFVFSHRIAGRLASSLAVSVEGAYLRIRQHSVSRSDRKLHFRAIVDFAVIQDDLARYAGVEALSITTTAGGNQSTIIIPGVKDCLKVRDLLAEIDRLRENV